MPRHSETVLLLEARSYFDSEYASVLTDLGYGHLRYSNYTESVALLSTGGTIDGVVAVWTAASVDRHRFARAVANATKLPRARGALIISPFATEENAMLLRRCGARGWARSPVSMQELEARLDHLLHGDRRRAAAPVPVDRRRSLAYPVAVPA